MLFVLFTILFVYLDKFSKKKKNNNENDEEIIIHNKKESMTSIHSFKFKNNNRFCESVTDKKCENLGELGCNSVKCCVLAVNKKNKNCLMGNKDGPFYLEDDDSNPYDYYEHLSKKYNIKI